MDTQLFLTILLWLMIGSATSYYAYQRGRDPLLWFMVGMMLGLFGLLLLFVLPVVEPEGQEQTQKDSSTTTTPSPTAFQSEHQDHVVKDWYYYDGAHERHGPVRYDTLKVLWHAGDIDENSYVWCEGMTDWKRIEHVPALHTHLVIQE